jgi:hypothetical protein
MADMKRCDFRNVLQPGQYGSQAIDQDTNNPWRTTPRCAETELEQKDADNSKFV